MLYYELFQIKKSKLKISMVYTITLQVAKRQKFEFDEKKNQFLLTSDVSVS